MAIKVSQATIDKIKKMGMTKALAGTGSANAEMREALTRMYGARRVAAAAAASKAAAPSTQRKYGTPNVTSKPKMVDAKGPNAVGKKPAVSTQRKYGTPNVTSKSEAAKAKKKTETTDPFAKFVFAQGRALAEPFKSKPKPKK